MEFPRTQTISEVIGSTKYNKKYGYIIKIVNMQYTNLLYKYIFTCNKKIFFLNHICPVQLKQLSSANGHDG